MLKDFAIDLEIQRDFYRDVVVLSAPSQNPEKFVILEKIQKLYNQSHKTSIETLIENYKKEFGDGKTKEMKIRLRDEGKRKISEIVKNLPQK
jgi:ribosomal protein S20